MRITQLVSGLMAASAATFLPAALAGAALAQDALNGLPIVGAPAAKGTGFQPAGTDLAVDQQWLDHILLYVCIGVVTLVLVLLAVVILRYNERANPTPAKFTHNSPLEVAWTLVPVLILVGIGSFSLPILFKQVEMPVADISIKATGNQWFWSYEYPDEGIAFDSYMIGHPATLEAQDEGAIPYVLDDAMKARLARAGYTADEWLLATDTAMVVPVNKIIAVQTTAGDVIHGWYVPSFAVQHSAVPGRIGESWFKADREGVYFGQCTTLCGKDHAYMPITVKVVSQDVYDAWVAANKTASLHLEPEQVRVKLASAD